MDDRLKTLASRLDPDRMPRHVAMIMDGNGRWAKQRGLPRSAGHYKGIDTVREMTEISSELGIGYLTLYAFSTENWNRPKEEVDTLMHLISMAIENETPALLENNVRMHLVGGIDELPEEARDRLYSSTEILSGNTGLTLGLCLNYSSRSELTRMARMIAADAAEGRLKPGDVTAEDIERRLQTYPMPDPDLLIRTGGEHRLSNFLLWQLSYAELLFTPTLWPDFTKADYINALIDFQSRERRYGRTSEQVNNQNDNKDNNDNTPQ